MNLQFFTSSTPNVQREPNTLPYVGCWKPNVSNVCLYKTLDVGAEMKPNLQFFTR